VCLWAPFISHSSPFCSHIHSNCSHSHTAWRAFKTSSSFDLCVHALRLMQRRGVCTGDATWSPTCATFSWPVGFLQFQELKVRNCYHHTLFEEAQLASWWQQGTRGREYNHWKERECDEGVSECCSPETLRRLHDANSSSGSWIAGENLWRFTLKGTQTPSDTLRHTQPSHIHTHSRRIETDTRTEHMENEDYVLISEGGAGRECYVYIHTFIYIYIYTHTDILIN
jgi:hypothetical protein